MKKLVKALSSLAVFPIVLFVIVMFYSPDSGLKIRNVSGSPLEKVELRYVIGPSGKVAKAESLGSLAAGHELSTVLRPPGEGGVQIAVGEGAGAYTVSCTGYLIHGEHFSAELGASGALSFCEKFR